MTALKLVTAINKILYKSRNKNNVKFKICDTKHSKTILVNIRAYDTKMKHFGK